MKSFIDFLKEETVVRNAHMEHIEDLVFIEGSKGTEKAIKFLGDLRDMLAGNSLSKTVSTVKWDGCVHEDTIILTNAGDMTIKEIVESEHLWGELEIMGQNLNDDFKYDAFSLLLSGNKSEGNKPWVEVHLEDGSSIKLTEDHEVHTQRGWVKAVELLETDDITEL